MSKLAVRKPKGIDRKRVLADAREVIDAEGRAALALADVIDGGFCDAVDAILACRGRVVVTGLGKSGLVGQKLSATLASTGTPSLFLHAAEAVHGDMGRITRDDVVLALSNSGESEEIVRLVKPVKALGARLVALVGDPESSLARHADIVMHIGDIAEACPMGLVPTTSTTAMMVLGDALAMCLFNCRGFGREEYARFHPGGQLGRKLMKVEEVMRRGEENPVVRDTATLHEVLLVMTQTKGRPGAACVVDSKGKLVGFFTDGDLRRLSAKRGFNIDMPITRVMIKGPKTVRPNQLVAEAERLLREHQIDQLPVVDDAGVSVGIIDVQDLLSTR